MATQISRQVPPSTGPRVTPLAPNDASGPAHVEADAPQQTMPAITRSAASVHAPAPHVSALQPSNAHNNLGRAAVASVHQPPPDPGTTVDDSYTVWLERLLNGEVPSFATTAETVARLASFFGETDEHGWHLRLSQAPWSTLRGEALSALGPLVEKQTRSEWAVLGRWLVATADLFQQAAKCPSVGAFPENSWTRFLQAVAGSPFALVDEQNCGPADVHLTAGRLVGAHFFIYAEGYTGRWRHYPDLHAALPSTSAALSVMNLACHDHVEYETLVRCTEKYLPKEVCVDASALSPARLRDLLLTGLLRDENSIFWCRSRQIPCLPASVLAQFSRSTCEEVYGAAGAAYDSVPNVDCKTELLSAAVGWIAKNASCVRVNSIIADDVVRACRYVHERRLAWRGLPAGTMPKLADEKVPYQLTVASLLTSGLQIMYGEVATDALRLERAIFFLRLLCLNDPEKHNGSWFYTQKNLVKNLFSWLDVKNPRDQEAMLREAILLPRTRELTLEEDIKNLFLSITPRGLDELFVVQLERPQCQVNLMRTRDLSTAPAALRQRAITAHQKLVKNPTSGDLVAHSALQLLLVPIEEILQVTAECLQVSLFAFMDADGSHSAMKALGYPRPGYPVWSASTAKLAFDKLVQRLDVAAPLVDTLRRSIPDELEDPRFQKALVSAAGFAVGLYRGLTAPQLDWLLCSGLVDALYATPAPDLRPRLAMSLAALARSTVAVQAFDRRPPLRLENKGGEGRLLRAGIALLEAQGVDLEPIVTALDGKLFKIFRDGPKARELLSALHGLCIKTDLPRPAVTRIVKTVLDATTTETVTTRVRLLNLALRSSNAEPLADPSLSFEQAGELILREMLGDIEVDDVHARYARTFGASRQPNAAMEYVANLRSLNEGPVDDAVRSFVRATLEGTFLAERHDPRTNEHLRALEQLKPGVLKQWAQDATAPVTLLHPVATWQPAQWLTERVFDLERLPGAADQVPELASLLKPLIDPAVRKAAAAKFRPSAADVQFLQARPRAWLAFAQACIELVQCASNRQVEALRKLQRQVTKLDPKCKFAHDLISIMETITKAPPSSGAPAEVALDTADPVHLLLCGTDVPKSCLHVRGEAKLNKSLLGYLLNGQTRLLAVVDGTTQAIRARCIFRLLTDGVRPVLYVERLYGSEIYLPALMALARQKADRMGLDLFEGFLSKRTALQRPLESLGGRAPYEYCDALYYFRSDSRFAIQKGNLVKDPE